MNKSELIDTLTKLTETDDVAGIRKLIRRNPEMNNMNCRELNEDFIINNHRFVKRNGKISLIKDESRYPNAKNAVFVGSYQTRKNLDNNDGYSVNSSIQTDLNDDEYTLIIEQQQQQINELKEQIEYIKAYNNDLVPRTEELEQITGQMKKLFSNFV